MENISSNIIKINVGGKLFSTSKQTLQFHSCSFFSSLINNSKTDENEFFIDRDPKYFAALLNYMRNNKLDVTDLIGLDFNSLLQEATYYQLNSLAMKIKMLRAGNSGSCYNLLYNGEVGLKKQALFRTNDCIGPSVPIAVSTISTNQNQGHYRNRLSEDLSRMQLSTQTDNAHIQNINRNLTAPRVSSSHLATTNSGDIAIMRPLHTNTPSIDPALVQYIEKHHINKQITMIKSSHKWMAVCHPYTVKLYWYFGDTTGWECVWESPPLSQQQFHVPESDCKTTQQPPYMVQRVALKERGHQLKRNPTATSAATASSPTTLPASPISQHRHNSAGIDANTMATCTVVNEVLLAIASGPAVSLYHITLDVVFKSPVDYNLIPLSSSVTDNLLLREVNSGFSSTTPTQFSHHQNLPSIDNTINHMVFLGGNLMVTSNCVQNPFFGFWQSQAHRWHSCSVNSHINCYSVVSKEFIILGCENGGIYQLNAQKFPLRLSDNSLLYTEIFKDPSGDSITALDIYDNSQKCCSHIANCLEIAYGTRKGLVRIVVQHAGVNEGPKIFQTLSVHRAEISKIVISEKYLISVCSNGNHVRTWLISRFRGTLNTQPGTTPLASFHLLTLDVDPLVLSCDNNLSHGNRSTQQNLHKPNINEIKLRNGTIDDDDDEIPHVDDDVDELDDHKSSGKFDKSDIDVLLSQQVHNITIENADVGPFTDALLFVQKLLPNTDRLFIRHAHNGARVCCVGQSSNSVSSSIIGSLNSTNRMASNSELAPITSFCIHQQSELGGSSCVNTFTMTTGHSNGTLQNWDIGLALDYQNMLLGNIGAAHHTFLNSAAGNMGSGILSPTASATSSIMDHHNYQALLALASSNTGGGSGTGGGGNCGSQLSWACNNGGAASIVPLMLGALAQYAAGIVKVNEFPGRFDEPSENGPTPRELFDMLQSYYITMDNEFEQHNPHHIILTPCVSHQSLNMDVVSLHSTLTRTTSRQTSKKQ